MRNCLLVVALLIFSSLLGCTHKPTSTGHGQSESFVPKGESLELLNSVANDPSKNPADRARAVFTLFSRHVKPGAFAKDMRRVFAEATWLSECHYQCVRIMNGSVPIDWPEGVTVYQLGLFPKEKGVPWTPWYIYFSLSGDLKDEDGLAFLKGEPIPEKPRLVEFALCFPCANNRHCHFERFFFGGMRAFDLDQ